VAVLERATGTLDAGTGHLALAVAECAVAAAKWQWQLQSGSGSCRVAVLASNMKLWFWPLAFGH
jgi:hypothetical protein